MPSPSDYYAPWALTELHDEVRAHYERRLAEDSATIASLREEVETLKMLLPPVGSVTYPPGCEEYTGARQVAGLRDRLRIMAPMVCEGCGCAPATHTVPAVSYSHWLSRGQACCYDCRNVVAAWEWWDCSAADICAACVSVGLRSLCGRRILEGC